MRNNVHPVLGGEGAECLINGLFVGAGRQHLDNYMLVEHAQPQCSSRQFYNGILDGAARGVFHGRIVVHKDAQKTDAKQTNRNLLLSDNARIDTKPQLEIHADDVKCTHGATIGQIEEEQLFYLRSRGFSEAEARNTLLYAFAAECLDRMKEPAAREFVEGLIRERLTELARSRKTSASAAPAEDNAPGRSSELGGSGMTAAAHQFAHKPLARMADEPLPRRICRARVSISQRFAAISRFSPSRSTARLWCISTMRRPRRSRAR